MIYLNLSKEGLMARDIAQTWQARQIQRQMFVNRIVDDVLVWGKRSMPGSTKYILEMSFLISGQLIERKSVPESINRAKFSTQLVNFFDNYIQGPLENFSRSEEEADVLRSEIAQKLLEIAGYDIRTRLKEQEFLNPSLIFGSTDRIKEIKVDRRLFNRRRMAKQFGQGQGDQRICPLERRLRNE
jgi:hypothetical protein